MIQSLEKLFYVYRYGVGISRLYQLLCLVNGLMGITLWMETITTFSKT